MAALHAICDVTDRGAAGLLGMPIKLIPVAALMIAAFAGCGSSSSSAHDDPKATASTQVAAAAAKGPKLKLVESDYGTILSNGSGRALYLFTADRGKSSNCSGDCATAWPPYIVKSKPVAGRGVRSGKIGTTRRDDGKLQATYAGHPLYFYEGDNEPGEVLCQAVNEFGGYWYVVRSSGKAAR
jgi:predicted lipoprotein with Yx(FWY)xxD motif